MNLNRESISPKFKTRKPSKSRRNRKSKKNVKLVRIIPLVSDVETLLQPSNIEEKISNNTKDMKENYKKIFVKSGKVDEDKSLSDETVTKKTVTRRTLVYTKFDPDRNKTKKKEVSYSYNI